MCTSLDLECIWPNEIYVDEIYDYTRPFKVICMWSMYASMEYVVILIIYTILVEFSNILKNMDSFEMFLHGNI